MSGEEAQLQRVVRLVTDTIGPTVLGIYLHGSAVHGGLKPASDLDLLVVTGRTLGDAERRALVHGLLPISGPDAGGRHLELTVVVQSEVRPWRYPPTLDFLYGDWLRAEFQAGRLPQPTTAPDLALVVTLTLAGGRTLAGPPPADLLDPVPPADVVRATQAGVPDLLVDIPGDTRNVVLTLARVWTTLATGEIRSKDEAADWALTRLRPEHRPVLAYARELYLTRTYREETWSDDLRARVEPCVEAMLAEIDALPVG